MDSGSNPSARSPSFRSPFWPKMAIKPSTATMTGKINGAPKSIMVTSRPQKRLLAKARASGMAKTTESAADSAACISVKRSAAHSAGPNRAEEPAFSQTAISGAITNAASAAPVSLQMMKSQVYRHLNMPLGEAIAETNDWMAQSLTKDDFREGVRSFIEKRPPQFTRVTV